VTSRPYLSGELTEQLPVEPTIRVYSVVIAIDRRVRTSGLRFWLDEVFASVMGDFDRRRQLGALAVWTLEDLETIEELVRRQDPALKGTPRGVLRLLRTWEMTRDKLPKTGKRAAGWRHFVGHQIPAPAVNQRLKDESDRWWDEVKEVFTDAPGQVTDLPPKDSMLD